MLCFWKKKTKLKKLNKTIFFLPEWQVFLHFKNNSDFIYLIFELDVLLEFSAECGSD